MIKDKVEHIKALSGMLIDEWRFWAKVDTSGDCWEWQGAKSTAGYGIAVYKSRPRPAHRLAWFFVHGEVLETEQFLLHKCDNPGCVNPDHLEIGTAAENTRDMIDKGRMVTVGSPRLSYDLAEMIRVDYKTGEFTQGQLAEKYSVSGKQIYRIVTNRAWVPGKIHKTSNKSILQLGLL